VITLHEEVGDLPERPDRGERAERWAKTMAGFTTTGGLRTAHDQSRQRIGTVAPWRREDRELEEARQLAPGATRALGAGNRARPEPPDAYRTCFERDRDRILHSTAFRRLAGKTQVFVFPADHQRTRLTHALEVAQVACAIARSLRLNASLTEAIALGHDCGHGPGGHASEDAFSPYLADGFDHAVFGADVTLVPLNLTTEVLDGVRNHSWSRPAPATPEGEVVSWADRIAYVCHDFEDAVHAGIVSPAELPAAVRRSCGESRPRQIGTFVSGLVEASLVAGAVGMPAELADALAEFRAFNHERIYLRPESLAQADAVISVLRCLVDHLVAHPDQIPQDPPGRPSTPVVPAAVAYAAAMTDRYAFGLAVHDAGWPEDRLPVAAGLADGRGRREAAADSLRASR